MRLLVLSAFLLAMTGASEAEAAWAEPVVATVWLAPGMAAPEQAERAAAAMVARARARAREKAGVVMA